MKFQAMWQDSLEEAVILLLIHFAPIRFHRWWNDVVLQIGGLCVCVSQHKSVSRFCRDVALKAQIPVMYRGQQQEPCSRELRHIRRVSTLACFFRNFRMSLLRWTWNIRSACLRQSPPKGHRRAASSLTGAMKVLKRQEYHALQSMHWNTPWPICCLPKTFCLSATDMQEAFVV